MAGSLFSSPEAMVQSIRVHAEGTGHTILQADEPLKGLLGYTCSVCPRLEWRLPAIRLGGSPLRLRFRTESDRSFFLRELNAPGHCPVCGEVSKVGSVLHRTLVGRYTVEESREGRVCPRGHSFPGVPVRMELARGACLSVLSRGEVVGGPEVRSIRRALGMTELELEAYLGAGPMEVRCMEVSLGDIPRSYRMALWALLVDPLVQVEKEASPGSVLRREG